MNKAWYGQTQDEVLAALESRPDGLTDQDAAGRLKQFGPNEIAFKKTPAWRRFLRQFNDPMVLILIATAVVTGTLTVLGSEMLPDTVVIVSVVLLNAVLGFVQEGKAEGALDALRNMMVQECLVLRGRDERRIPARELVPGDIVILEGGDKIPADIRFLEVSNTHVDESSLTGESVPVKKLTAAQPGTDLVPGDQKNMGFSGTYLTQGTARGLVVETGLNTVFGRIADMVKVAEAGLTPLQRKMKEFVRTLIIAILVVGAFNFGYSVYLGYAMTYSFLGAVSLVVAAIPEMLPALVTSILALSGVVMASRKALIRKLPAAETLGATSVICSDKTGTLTENRMTVTRVFAGGVTFQVTGTGYLDTELIQNAWYCYRIQAVDNASAQSAYSSAVCEQARGRYYEAPNLVGNPGAETRIQSAVIEWLTDREGSSFVEYGETNSYGEETGKDDFVSSHSVTLLDLEPATTYHYRVRFTDEDNNTGYSDDYTFTTADAPSAPTNLSVTPEANSQNSFQFTWEEPLDEGVDIQGYYYSINQEPSETNSSYTAQTSLGPGPYATQQGVNTFYVVAIDEANNINYDNFASIDFEANTAAPSIPSGLIITDSSNRENKVYSITLVWEDLTAASAYQGQASDDITYIVERSVEDNDDFTQIAETEFTITRNMGRINLSQPDRSSPHIIGGEMPAARPIRPILGELERKLPIE